MSGRPHIQVQLRRPYALRDGGPAIERAMERRWGVDVAVAEMMEDEMSRHGDDFEGVLADLGPTSASRAGALSARRTAGSGTGGRRGRAPEPELAEGLALLTARMQAICARDPEIPGRPSQRSMARILSHCLDQVPGRSGASLAAELNARIRGGRAPVAGGRALEHTIMRAAERMRAPDGRLNAAVAREQAFPALVALLPMLKGLLPSLIPALAPLLGSLLGGLAGGKSMAVGPPLKGRAMGGIDVAHGLGPDGRIAGEQSVESLVKLLMDLIPELAPVFAKMIADAAPGVVGQLVGALRSAAPAAPVVPVQPAAVAGNAPEAAVAQGWRARAAEAAAGTGGGGAKLDPAMIAGILKNIDPKAVTGLIQGIAGNAGGINQLLGGPGHELLKSVVERLPVEKMFDARAWVPEINHDQFVSTIPWSAVLSLGDAAGMVGQLFVPGRKQIQADRRIEVALPRRALTDLGDGETSWIFVSDRTCRIPVAFTAGPERLDAPFLDVRVSCDGTPRTGLKRCVWRMAPLEAGASAGAAVELDPDVLMQAERAGGRICLAIRLVQRREGGSGPPFFGNELRLCAHVTAPNRIILDGAEPLRERDTATDAPGLLLRIPSEARSGAAHLRYRIGLAEGPGLARHLPLVARPGPSGDYLAGGVEITPEGYAELTRRGAPGATDPLAAAAVAGALAADPTLRARLMIETVERLPVGTGPLTVEPVLHAQEVHLVSFVDIDENGNPARREVRKIQLPVPVGMRIGD